MNTTPQIAKASGSSGVVYLLLLLSKTIDIEKFIAEISWDWVFGIALVVVTTFSFVFFFNNRMIHQRRLDQRKKEVQQAELMIKGQDAERYRIASELHDSFGNHLAVLNTHAQRKYPEDQQLKRYIQRLAFEVRQINEDLSGKSVHAMGFEAAFEALVKQWHQEAGVWIEFQYDVPKKLILAQQLSMYRIFQELIKNAIDHGGATMILIEIREKGLQLQSVFTDDGKGFESTNSPRGLGLSNIQHRVYNMNGFFHVHSSPEGTTFNLGFPFLT